MARARNIKPGFFTNDLLAEIAPLGRLLFAGLWTIADREGRLEDRPKKIKAEVLPFDNCNVDKLLADLNKHGFITRYSVNGTAYIQIVTWCKHQNPHVKEAASTIPAPCKTPDKHGASTVQAPDEEQPFPERAGLIPDSLNLIPDSLIHGGAEQDSRSQHDEAPPRVLDEPEETPEQTRARILGASGQPAPPQPVMATFRMTHDWRPNPETLAGVCLRRGFNAALITQDVLGSFTTYWTAQLNAFDESVWISKLIDSAKTQEARHARNQSNTDRRVAVARATRDYDKATDF